MCVIATLVDQGMAVVGFLGLEAGGLELDANCGLGSKYPFNAVPFLRQASGTERAKAVALSCGTAYLIVLIAAGEA